MFKFIQIAVRNLLKNRSRTLILSASITITSIILTLLMSLTSGIEDTMIRSSTTLLTGHVNIAGFHKISSSSAAPVVKDYKNLEDFANNYIKDTTVVLDRIKGWGKIVSDTASLQYPMWGVDINTEKDIKEVMEIAPKEKYGNGSFDCMKERGGVLIFENHADRLGVLVGDAVTISMPTYRNIYNTKDVTVCAVLKDIGFLSQFGIFLHKEDLRELYQMNETTTGQIMIYLKNVKDTSKVENQLRTMLSKKGYRLMEKESKPFWMKFERVTAETWTGQKIDITTWEDEISFMKWIIKTFSVLSILLVFVLLFIIVLGITNSVWMSIKERTSEIGTLRAIGMHRREVLKMFVLEGFILSATSSFVGTIFGVVLCYIINFIEIPITSLSFKVLLLSDHIILLVKPSNLIFSFITITFFATCGSILPAYRASKMKPVTAINLS